MPCKKSRPGEMERYIAFRTRAQAYGALEMLRRMRCTGAISAFAGGQWPYYQIRTNCSYRQSKEVLATVHRMIKE